MIRLPPILLMALGAYTMQFDLTVGWLMFGAGALMDIS